MDNFEHRQGNNHQTPREIYMMKVNGEWGALMPRKRGSIVFMAGNTSFVDFVQGIMEDYPSFKLRCVNNEGIAAKIAEHQKAERIMQQASSEQKTTDHARQEFPSVFQGRGEGR
jgi:hypothetical protein